MSRNYIYEHWRPDKDTCFYVGRGQRSRAWLMAGRNRHHRSIVSKLISLGFSVDVRIIKDGLSLDEAKALEIEQIALYGINNLSNMTSGGEGIYRPTEELRAKMSASSKKRWSDPKNRENASEKTRAAMSDPSLKERIASKKRGKKQSPESIAKRVASLRGRKMSPEFCERMKGKGNPFFGKRHSPETLASIAAKKRGTKLSDATREKMREAQRIRRSKEASLKPPPSPKIIKSRFGRQHTPETIAKMKIAAKIRGVSPITRAAQIKAQTGRTRIVSPETVAKMRIAATKREAKKRAERAAR